MNNSKIELINNYIKRCDDIISSQDFDAAKFLFLEMYSIFSKELPNWWDGLQSNYGRAITEWEYRNPFWLQDMPIIKAKLLNYIATLESQVTYGKPLINIVNNNTANAATQNTINFETEIKIAQNKISEMDSLSEQDTQEALKKLDELFKIVKSVEPRKSKWNKIGSVLKWLADKSVELAVAFSPALMQVISRL